MAIVINEIDNTLPGSVSESTDIAYVPGFTAKNYNCYISEVAGDSPLNRTPIANGTATTAEERVTIDLDTKHPYPQFFVNTSDKKLWYCTSSQSSTETATATATADDVTAHEIDVTVGSRAISITGVKIGTTSYTIVEENPVADTSVTAVLAEGVVTVRFASADALFVANAKVTAVYAVDADWAEGTYKEPSPENIPVLCNGLTQFEKAFGKVPYKLTETVTKNFVNPQDAEASISITFYRAGDYEKSYIYARELIANGLLVMFEDCAVRNTDGPTKGTKKEFDIDLFYGGLSAKFETLKDRGEYTVKYLTTGAYPTFELSGNAEAITKMMLETALTRGECTALIDHCNNPGRVLTGAGSVFDAVNSATSPFMVLKDGKEDTFGAMFTPWAIYNATREAKDVPVQQILPASFAFLSSLARSIKTNANHFAIAGPARGVVPNIVALNTTSKLTNTIAESYQPNSGGIAVNAITNVRPYGLTIWGNGTLKYNDTGLVALSFLNTRNMVNDIKKVAFTTANACMFEQNSEVLWLKFKAGIMPFLDQLQTGQGIKKYKIIPGTTDQKAKLVAIIKIYPIYAVKDFDITVLISDEEVAVQ